MNKITRRTFIVGAVGLPVVTLAATSIKENEVSTNYEVDSVGNKILYVRCDKCGFGSNSKARIQLNVVKYNQVDLMNYWRITHNRFSKEHTGSICNNALSFCRNVDIKTVVICDTITGVI